MAVLVKDQKTAKWLGIGASIIGAVLLWDAHEHRNKKRPFALRWIPGG